MATNTVAAYTALSWEDMARIPNGPHVFISWNDACADMQAPSGHRPRVYAYVERGEFAGQIVAIRSRQNLDQYHGDMGFLWRSGSTLADHIRPA